MTASFDPALLAGLNIESDPASGAFRIVIPEKANIAADTIGRHAVGARSGHPAIVFETVDGGMTSLTYGEVDAAAGRLATWLADAGIGPGDRVAVHSGPRPETVIAHMATYKLGAIVVTLSQLYGAETVGYILDDCTASVLITQDSVWAPLRHLRDKIGTLKHCLVVGETAPGETPFEAALAGVDTAFEAVETRAEDPALLIYTSGSTGQPKGILHAHRIVHAYNVSTAIFYNLEIDEVDLVFWTPADWAWVGGLNDTVFPAWWHGHTVVATQHRFEPEWALDFMARHGVTHAFITPTALKRMATVAAPRARHDLKLRTIFTGGEPVPAETFRWITGELGAVCNEGYGMTEVNHMIGNSQRLRMVKPGSMGWGFPGHRAAIVDEEGNELPDGEVGEIVTGADDPTLFLGYWGQPELTDSLRLGPWVRTHDVGVRDADGYFWYHGRNDDLIKSAGYRIGPTEVEGALLDHPAVADAGVIGVADPDRGQVVKAFILPAAGYVADDGLAEALRDHVKTALGPYKAPRLIEFVDALPTTSSGKVSRGKLRELHENFTD